MRVLAIDTALANCAAAVLDDGADKPCLAVKAAEIGRGHAEQLMAMIGDVMAELSTAFTDLDRVVVTTGPGSFTGLRVGLSVARGFGLVLSKPVVGVTTLAALAVSVPPRQAGRAVLVALDGKGDEVYCQAFGAGLEALSDPCVRTVQEIAAELEAGTGLAGSAARRIAAAANRPEEDILSEAAYPDITDVARLGLVTDPRTAAAVPLYLRPPDATPQKKGRIERQ